jgi:hypothetical protein
MMSIYTTTHICAPEPQDLKLYANDGNERMSGFEIGSVNAVAITSSGPENTRAIAARLRDLADQMDAAAALMPADAAADALTTA